MRAFLCFLAVLLLALAGYAYVRNPAGLEKLVDDTNSIVTAGSEKLRDDAGPVVTSLSPIPLQPDAASPISALIQGKLISADGSPFSFPADTPVASIQYYAIYYSAQWCPPCHAFTPVLAEWYKKFKPSHPNFELIFVSDDHDKASMLAYMKEMAMPWPAFSFDDLKHDGNGIEKFAGSGIPDLVLVDAGGKVLSDSFASTGSYLGPRHVLDDIEKLVVPSAPAPPAEQPAAAAPAPASVSAVPNPPPPPIKAWAPPAVMPSQPNWTWTTSDGTTYQNVVVTKIEPETVTITHLMGAAHVPISALLPDIQKKLGYDPVAAAAARAESKRELAHPYYSFADRAQAQNIAQQMHWPLAWLDSTLDYSTVDPQLNPWADLTQMSLSDLKSHAIIIFIDNNEELGDLPSSVRDQLFILDDGPMPGGHHFYGPKIVISNPDATRIFGRVSYTQMKASGALAIDEVLDSIPKDSDAQSPSNGPTVSAPAPPASSPTPVLAPAASPATAAATPSPDAVKPWAPPDVMPSQPNWTWTTSDGATYQDVVVTEIEPDTVTITHSMGVAHISIYLLPPDIQKQLNYDPHAASHGN